MTIAIAETFAKVREIERTIKTMPTIPQNLPKHQEMMQRAADLNSELVAPEESEASETEASIEANLLEFSCCKI